MLIRPSWAAAAATMLLVCGQLWTEAAAAVRSAGGQRRCAAEAEPLGRDVTVFSRPNARSRAQRLSAGEHYIYRCRTRAGWSEIRYTRRPVNCSRRDRPCPLGWVRNPVPVGDVD